MSSRSPIEKIHAGQESSSGQRKGCGRRHGHREAGHFFGLDVEEMSPKAQVVAALAVLAPVALSGVFLVAFAPGLWWVFTTYFWVAFPAFGLLTRGITGSSEQRAATSPTRSTGERELLEALRREGEVSPTRAAMETSLSVAEADAMLKKLAEAGHLEVRVRGGGLFYALWEGAERPALQVHPAELREIGKTTNNKEVHAWPR